jgi:hypothetical protein
LTERSSILAIVDNKVIACVLSERHQNREACHPECEHDREGSLVAYVLRMRALHVATLGNVPDADTMSGAPE